MEGGPTKRGWQVHPENRHVCMHVYVNVCMHVYIHNSLQTKQTKNTSIFLLSVYLGLSTYRTVDLPGCLTMYLIG